MENTQENKAKEILENLKNDGRFDAKLWIKDGKARIYVGSYGYIAIGQDGTPYPNLSRLSGNITRAAGIRQF